MERAMSKEPTDVMIAAYYDTEPARVDYDAVLHAGAKLEGAVCVSRDHAGDLHVEEHDHLARKGAEVLGGAGVVVGLFAPPLLLATAAGAAVGGALGALAHHEVTRKLEQQAFDTIPYGGAGLIVAYPRSSAQGVDQAVTHSLKKAVGEAEGKKLDALKQALAEAQNELKQPVQ
jgi:arylsulfatase